MIASGMPSSLISPLAHRCLPTPLSRRWEQLRSGTGEQPPIDSIGPAVVLTVVEAIWWGRPLDSEWIDRVIANPDHRVCAGLELLHHAMHRQDDLSSLIHSFEEVGTPHAMGLAFYARGFQTRASHPSSAITSLQRAHLLLLSLIHI